MKYPVKNVGLKHLDWVGLVLSTELPTISKSIVMYLSRFMNKDQDCAWPSWARMMAELGVSRGAMNKHLDILESEGWITRHKGNSVKTTKYFISFPRQIEAVISGRGSSRGELGSSSGELGGSSRGELRSSRGELGVVHEVNSNRQLEIVKGIDNALFEEFWKSYPRKEAKKPAEKAFARLPEKDQRKALSDIQGGRFHKTDKKFIPYASTYLNQERWNDEVKNEVGPDQFAGAL